ncbi:hypothetical protein OIO90_001323 [Microbotryomycetes sp. JL221]|nr:hypothetical protein OIO90_001323 [Microbotryomycetes sp. JL221]
MSLLSRMAPREDPPHGQINVNHTESADSPAPGAHSSRTRIRGARKSASKGQTNSRGGDETQSNSTFDATHESTTVPVDINQGPEHHDRKQASSQGSSNGAGASVSPHKRRGAQHHPMRAPEGETHLVPLNKVVGGPPGRDTTSSRWATVSAHSPPARAPPSQTSQPAAKSTATRKPTEVRERTVNVDALSSGLAKMNTAGTSIAPPRQDDQISTKSDAQPPRRRVARTADPVKRPVLGGRSRWAQPEDDADETVYEPDLSVSIARDVVDTPQEAPSTQEIAPSDPTAVEQASSTPPTADEHVRPSTPPSKAPLSPSTFTSPSQHIDWAEEDDDELPDLDEWLQEVGGTPLPVSSAPEPETRVRKETVVRPSFSIFGSAMQGASASTVRRTGGAVSEAAAGTSRQARSRTTSNASDMSSATSTTVNGTGSNNRRNRRRASKGHADKPAEGINGRDAQTPKARGVVDPAWNGRKPTDQPIIDSAKKGARRARGGGGGAGRAAANSHGADAPSLAAKTKSETAPARPSGAVFAKLSGLTGPSKREGGGGAGVQDGRPSVLLHFNQILLSQKCECLPNALFSSGQPLVSPQRVHWPMQQPFDSAPRLGPTTQKDTSTGHTVDQESMEDSMTIKRLAGRAVGMEESASSPDNSPEIWESGPSTSASAIVATQPSTTPTATIAATEDVPSKVVTEEVVPIYAAGNLGDSDPRLRLPPRPAGQRQVEENNRGIGHLQQGGISFHAGVFPLPGLGFTWSNAGGFQGPGQLDPQQRRGPRNEAEFLGDMVQKIFTVLFVAMFSGSSCLRLAEDGLFSILYHFVSLAGSSAVL